MNFWENGWYQRYVGKTAKGGRKLLARVYTPKLDASIYAPANLEHKALQRSLSDNNDFGIPVFRTV
jgi:hypothetical protein